MIGVAISTTGHPHRLRFLETAVRSWRRALPLGSMIVVTVDGSVEAADRVREIVDAPQEDGHCGGNTYRVGQPPQVQHPPFNGRMGVAVNKNTGLELLMDCEPVDHLFLADDDVWPRHAHSLSKHINLATEHGVLHSMVCWGASRLNPESYGPYAEWKWPRGVLLYQTRVVVETIGGMDERFGPGGHEHAEWSQRIYNAGLTPAPFISPGSYGQQGPLGRATRASIMWHAEDMPREGETSAQFQKRKAEITSVQTTKEDWDHIHAVMAERKGFSGFLPFRAQDNGRASATLCRSNMSDNPSQGAEESK